MTPIERKHYELCSQIFFDSCCFKITFELYHPYEINDSFTIDVNPDSILSYKECGSEFHLVGNPLTRIYLKQPYPGTSYKDFVVMSDSEEVCFLLLLANSKNREYHITHGYNHRGELLIL
jgi:hypothetical protein